MPKQIVIAEQHRIAAVFSEDQIQELIVATGTHQVSDIYLGVVENVLPGIDAAFVNIGDSERNGFIHVSDLGPLKLRRTSASITELLAPQQKVLVQVMKEPTGNKGPRLTGNISLPGRYVVLMPNGKGVNLSRRIRNENERNRLRALAILIKPQGMGLVVRTEAENMPEEAIIEDLEALQRQWESVLQEATTTRAPALLNRDDDFIQRVLRDVYSGDVNRIVVDSHTGLKRVKQHLLSWNGGKSPQGVLIDHHRDRIPILEYFRINAAIREALNPRVDLPSGGYIIIERTEALTVIDVNSGSFTRSATARETVLWTNCEAATEIARQLRLRNIAGVIIVDFIDMDSRRDQLQVLEHFNKALRSDKARPQISQLSELGLVELTRKRQGKNIYELFGRACPTCGGLGHLVHLPDEPRDAEADFVERAPVALREPLGDRGSEARSWDDRSEDAEDDGADFGLNHPSYQEIGGANRRRRRRRIDEPNRARNGAWDEGQGRSTPTLPNGLNPKLDLPSADSDPFSPPDEPVLPGRPVRPERTNRGRGGRGRPGREVFPQTLDTPSPREVAAPPELRELAAPPEVVATPEIERDGLAPDDRPEDKRTRSRREVSRGPAEPPEVIAVEMTPEEQDVYAWMGISPLVLANREVKNPKSAIISVVLPGQTPPVPSPLESPAPVGPPVLASEPDAAVAVAKPAVVVAEPTPTPVAIELPSPAAEVEPEAVAEPAEPEATANRRRRRRSSAPTAE
ncbi:Rne/Rng family ribonuclease [Leptolyngbya sp. FACHB-36]|uniref:Rne/Rng family ribonuclease n=1 Tax=Leptolyngbya sp. FACHB-36 TaxID=2692808 RepID=UPI001681501E|nr:Rne/Rng family ribonuclease [Leptolyngbya sp. FACHB-36]MBD2021468.1 Rne/Rng family ribonuclease [Leptolyngbya sp. FACHB-36]